MTETGTDRDELARILAPVLVRTNPNRTQSFEDLTTAGQCRWLSRSGEAADAILAAGWRKPRTVTTVEELAPMPDGTVIIGPDGLVGEKRDFPLDLAVRYVNGTTETNHDIPMPALVLWTPGGER